MRQTIQTKDRVEYKILAKILTKLRKDARLSQEALGEMIDRSQQYIWKIEHGKQLPDFVAILDIIEATGGDAPEIIARVQAEAKKKSASRNA